MDKERDNKMKKNFFIAAVALFVAAVGVVIALAAYFKNRNSYLYDEDDDFLFEDDDDLEYYSAPEEVSDEPATAPENTDGDSLSF